MNKKGFLRIAEAVIAILIVLGAVLFVVVKQNNAVNSSDKLCEETNVLLDELAKNRDLRQSVLDEDINPVKTFLDQRVDNPLIDYRVRICGLDDACALNEGGLDNIEICAGERLISTVPEMTGFNPKKVKIFLLKLG